MIFQPANLFIMKPWSFLQGLFWIYIQQIRDNYFRFMCLKTNYCFVLHRHCIMLITNMESNAILLVIENCFLPNHINLFLKTIFELKKLDHNFTTPFSYTYTSLLKKWRGVVEFETIDHETFALFHHHVIITYFWTTMIKNYPKYIDLSFQNILEYDTLRLIKDFKIPFFKECQNLGIWEK